MNKLHGRVEQLEAKPTTDRWAQEHADHRATLRSQHYSDRQIDDIRDRGYREGISNLLHAHRIVGGSRSIKPGGNLPDDELAALMSGDDNEYFSLSIPRALNGE
jgi:hypothetical protein